MHRKRLLSILLPSLLAVAPARTTGQVTSGNPIITHIRCADPSAQVWPDGQVWIYASTDPEGATDYSQMAEYHAYSSYDLVNWTDHGVILSGEDVSWINSSKKWMFAPDAAYKDGTYFLFFPTMSAEWKWRVGVATSEHPEGPFTDVGHYIEGTDNIDPTCFIDDDGQAYLMWGGGDVAPKIARLKENMSELAEAPRTIDYGFDNFGEGGYMHKRNSIYYFSYTCNTCYPYQGFYATSDNPYGPFEYQGAMKKSPPGAQDHHSMIEYHGQWYYFYHTGDYGSNASLFQRNICIDSMFYNEDGTIPEIIGTDEGVGIDSIGMTPGNLVPGHIQAEDWFRQSGTEITVNDTATLASGIGHDDWLEYVIRVRGSGTYFMSLQLADVISGTEVFLIVNDIQTDTLQLPAGNGIVTDSIQLHEGKYTFRLRFSNPEASGRLAMADWIDFKGTSEYFEIASSSTPGGFVYPEGASYFKPGESVEYRIETFPGYILDSVVIDDTLRTLADSYWFNNISADHTMEVYFSLCAAIDAAPWYSINGQPEVNEKHIVATESESLAMRIETAPGILVSWTLPNGTMFSGNSFQLDSLELSHGGTYAVALTNEQGCTTDLDFTLTVNEIELDVYEAENYLVQSGTRTIPTEDLGGGWSLGNIENGDWCYYTISAEASGIYDLITRVSTASAGGSIDVSLNDSLLSTVNVTGGQSGDWDAWYTTAPVEIGLDAGVQMLKFSFRGGEGKLFNLNWFDLSFSREFEADTTTTDTTSLQRGLLITYPNPVINSTRISYTLSASSVIDLHIYNTGGARVKTLVPTIRQPAGTYTIRWNGDGADGSRLPDGLYLIRFSNNGIPATGKILLKR